MEHVSSKKPKSQATESPSPHAHTPKHDPVSDAALPIFLQNGVIQRQSDQEEDEEPVYQAKLTVSSPDDPYEQEADQAAAQAISGNDVGAISGLDANLMREQPEEPDDTVQRKAQPSASGRRKASRRRTSRPTGEPLPDTVRTEFETTFQRDFDDVQVHHNAEAAEQSESLHAQAFTHGHDIYFNQGKFEPQSESGKRLIAHELTHVVQQGGASGTIQRQETSDAPAPASAPPAATSAEGGRRSQSFSFSEDEMEARLSATPPDGAATTAPRVELEANTGSKLNEVENKKEGEQEGGRRGEAEAGREGRQERGREGRGGRGGRQQFAGGGTEGEAEAEVPGPAGEFEGMVSQQVAEYLEGNVSEERLAQLSPVTEQLLQGAEALGQRQITDPEASALAAGESGLQPEAQTNPYAQDEPWVQVVAQIRNVTSTLGGIVGTIGLIATVSGFILSLLIPPVGAFLLTVGRFCDIAALILDAVTLVLSGILTGYNLYKLKNATTPEEKRRRLGLVRQEAMQTVMSGIAVATAIAPGAARALGKTGLGRAVGRGASRLASGAGRTIGRAATRVAGSGVGRAVGRSFVGRGAAAVGRGVSSLGSRAVRRGQEFLVRLRGTGPVRWANRVTGQLEERARGYFRTLATRNTAFGRFYNRRIRGFHERNVMAARAINDPIERAYQQRLGRELQDELDRLINSGVTNPAQLNQQLRQTFGDRIGDATVGRSRGAGRVQFVRRDSDILREVREREFTELQLIRDLHPTATAAELAEHVKRSPFIQGQWTPQELAAFTNMHPGVRQASGDLVTGAVPKTAHHTIPAALAPQIHRDPRFMQLVNDDRFYWNFIQSAYGQNLRRMPNPKSVRVPGARPGQTRQAANLEEATQGMVDRGDFTVPNRNHFSSDQFVNELKQQGSTGVWVNPRNANEVMFFNPHFVIGHGWNWEREIYRQIFDMNTRLGLHGEPLRQAVMPFVRQEMRERRNAVGGKVETSASGPGEQMSTQSASLIEQAVQARHAAAQGAPPPAVVPPTPVERSEEGMATLAASAARTSLTGGGRSQAFVSSVYAAMRRPVVNFVGVPMPDTGEGSPGGGGVNTQAQEARQPDIPPSPALYSPQSLADIREQRGAVTEAIASVNTYIQETQKAQRDNQLAKEAAEAVKQRNADNSEYAQGERDDVSGQQEKLNQSETSQQNMNQENQRASNESDRGKTQGDSVQSEGQSVSVEAKPEEPKERSWLERAWDATVGAAWDALVAPAIRLVKRKVAQVMQKINDFIMRMINQALGLDDIEAGLSTGGEDIQQRRGSMQETDTGLQGTQDQAASEQERNEQSVQQADQNIADAQNTRSDAETLLADLIAQQEALQAEEDAGKSYIAEFGSRYQPFFARQQEMGGEAMMSSAETEPQAEPQPESEAVIAPVHVEQIVLYIDDLARAETAASSEVANRASASTESISPDLQSAAGSAAASAVAGFQSAQGQRMAQLSGLRTAAQDCVGLPMDAGMNRLQQITEQVMAFADALEGARQQALSQMAEPHLASSAGADESEEA